MQVQPSFDVDVRPTAPYMMVNFFCGLFASGKDLVRAFCLNIHLSVMPVYHNVGFTRAGRMSVVSLKQFSLLAC